MSDVSNGTGRLAGKVAAITGATSGSGLAIAKLFAAEGACVVLLARGSDRLKALEASLGPSATGVVTDVGDPDSVRAAFKLIADRFGKLDILINNAGIQRPCPWSRSATRRSRPRSAPTCSARSTPAARRFRCCGRRAAGRSSTPRPR